MNTRDRNRAEAAAHGMGCVAEWVDLLRAGGFKHTTPVHICAPDGWTVGKQDRAGEVDGIAMAHHATELARWFGKTSMKPDAAPKRRGMTDAQRACLRGDV
ncbi:MAG TPA: hypothetical protein VFP92_10705 [Rhodanobacteraceae bacterium]|nr:hypothetical protein [Rhodanobacteraceae bacterium]